MIGTGTLATAGRLEALTHFEMSRWTAATATATASAAGGAIKPWRNHAFPGIARVLDERRPKGPRPVLPAYLGSRSLVKNTFVGFGVPMFSSVFNRSSVDAMSSGSTQP